MEYLSQVTNTVNRAIFMYENIHELIFMTHENIFT